MPKAKGPVGESTRQLRVRQTPAKSATLQSPVAAPEAPPTAARNPAAEPSVPAPQPAAASGAAAAAYVTEKVPVPRSAKVKGQPGRVAQVYPEWTRRDRMRYPPEAMAEAVSLLEPANTPRRSKPRSIYSRVTIWMYCVRVLGRLFPHNSLDSSLCGSSPIMPLLPLRRRWHSRQRVEGQASGSRGGNRGENLPLGPPRRHTKPLAQR